MAKNAIFNTVEEAIEDFREGRIVIVVDDEDRETEIVNFMLSNGRGVLCAPLSESRCEELELNMMEENNTSLLGTPFTVKFPSASATAHNPDCGNSTTACPIGLPVSFTSTRPVTSRRCADTTAGTIVHKNSSKSFLICLT